jgi:hypothetical protein
MKKVFFVSLLLVSIFLIGNAELASAGCCTNYQDYYCTGITSEDGYIDDTWEDCAELCYDDGFEVYINDFAGWDEYYGYLYPAPDNKHLLGTFYDYTYGWGGLSVEFKGRSMIVNFTWIQNDDGYVAKAKCTPCNDCCY